MREIEAAYRKYAKIEPEDEIRKECHAWQDFVAGYRSAVSEFQEYFAIELLPCDCHFFKNQVCDHCQGLLRGLRKKIVDKEGSESVRA